ncbi:MAG: DUF433 domain-containing protein, partial [Microcoleaceae cyanobacterium]
MMESRELPAYSVPEVAKYLHLPVDTLRSWVHGRYYPTREEKRYSYPLIELPSNLIEHPSNLIEHPSKRKKILSFTNLIEAHVLSAILRESKAILRDHKIPLTKVRGALDYIQEKLKLPHPFASLEFQTDGIDLFIEGFGELITVSRDGQMALKAVLQTFLSRIERDEKGYALKLFPFLKNPDINAPRTVVIDPRISFARPVLVGTGIPTAILAERFKAGDSIDELAEDYGCEHWQIKMGI